MKKNKFLSPEEKADLEMLRAFLVDLKAHGKIIWSFDEQQADPIHQFYKSHIPDWINTINNLINK